MEQVGVDCLSRIADIPIAFTVNSIFRVEPPADGTWGLVLHEVDLQQPLVMDYDTYEERNAPAHWPEDYDVSNWAFFIAVDDGRDVGSAVVATDTPGLPFLGDRRDWALLWDIRVRPEVRRQGIGTKLLRRAADWARQRGCTQLKIDTQNINVRACRFYAKQGCKLGGIDLHTLAHVPKLAGTYPLILLLWYLDL